MLNKPKNYFKHLFPSPEKNLEFFEHETDLFLWDACLMYEELVGEKTNLMKIFVGWFIMNNKDILIKSEHKSFALIERRKYSSRLDFFQKMLIICQ